MSTRRFLLILLLPGLALFTALLFVPIARGFLTSLGWLAPDFPSIDSYLKLFTQEFYVRVLVRTFRIAVIVTLLTAIIAYPLAFRISQSGPRMKRYLYIALLAPLLISHAVLSFGWLVILSPHGLLDNALLEMGLIDEPLRLLFSETAIVIGLTHIFLPHMTMSIATSMNNIDPSIVQAARNLGASAWATFRRIILPMTLPGLLAGTTIVFSLAMSAFATPAFLGGSRTRVMSSLAYQQSMLVLDWRFAAAISFVMLAVSGVVLFTATRLFERTRIATALR